MDLEEDYVEYAAQFSLSLLAVSAVYFFEPNNLYSYGTLMLIPLLFGYTAYTSRDTFRSASFLAFIALIFAPLNLQTAAAAMIIGFGNVLISFFSRRDSFRSYYGSVTLPMLFTGIILGAGFFYGASLQPDVANEIDKQFSQFTAEKTNLIIDRTGIVEMQYEQQSQIVDDVAYSTLLATQGYVLNETEHHGFTPNQQQTVETAFEGAEESVLQDLTQAEDSIEDKESSKQIEKAVLNLLDGDTTVYLAPLIALTLYALNPIIGLFTAISAVSFRKLDEMYDDSGY